jgi:hypothetical protein
MSSRSRLSVNGEGLIQSVYQELCRNIGSMSAAERAWLPVKVRGPIG